MPRELVQLAIRFHLIESSKRQGERGKTNDECVFHGHDCATRSSGKNSSKASRCLFRDNIFVIRGGVERIVNSGRFIGDLSSRLRRSNCHRPLWTSLRCDNDELFRWTRYFWIRMHRWCVRVYMYMRVCARARLLLINPKGQAWPRSVFELTNRFLRYSFILHVTISRVIIDVILIDTVVKNLANFCLFWKDPNFTNWKAIDITSHRDSDKSFQWFERGKDCCCYLKLSPFFEKFESCLQLSKRSGN